MPGMCGMKLTLDEFQGEGVHFATVFFFCTADKHLSEVFKDGLESFWN